MPPLRCRNAPAPARLFVQLSMRRQASTPILDLLLPRQGHRNFTSMPKRLWQPSAVAQLQRRAFSTTLPIRATHTIYNPQHDEDGKEMVLEITPRAGKRLLEIMQKDKNPNLALRIQVESGGCHGFQYLMKLVTLPSALPSPNTPSATTTTEADSAGSSEINGGDTIFTYTPDDAPAPTDRDLTAAKIILDSPSLDLLKGSKVDFTMELIGSQFKIVDNPLATSSCGCGTSFDIKI
ncbi:hypothetical protein QBC43DRAFT_307375 [Cladorrhinum sp. PSN259]|nr:hypothetical protein QBC43DRAFT_307375 [Cladorrhinum sp. PSN259]